MPSQPLPHCPSTQFPDSLRTAVVLCAVTFVLATTVRVWGISERFWLLGDQIRDWRIALGPFTSLPLVGPATHVGGYTIGPAFYWILWLIRVLVGPWFDNLPHAGGIGQALLQSAADTLLLVAIWRRTGSAWIAGTIIVLLVTAGYDRALSALVWNPVVGSTLAKAATAVVLLEWHRGSPIRAGLTAALAWSAVHAYTGAIYVCVSVVIALLVDPLLASGARLGERSTARALARQAAAVAVAILLLQLPYVAHQVLNRFTDSAMGAVTDSVGRIASGRTPPEISKSVQGYVGAVASPRSARALHDAPAAGPGDCRLLALPGPARSLLLPVAHAGGGDDRGPRPHGRAAGALALVPARLRFADTQHAMPEYRALVDGSRTLARRGQPMRAVHTEFPVRPTGDPEFLYTILGGRIERSAPWAAVITATGDVVYRRDRP